MAIIVIITSGLLLVGRNEVRETPKKPNGYRRCKMISP